MQISLGFIETDSFFGAVEASNVMVKTSNVILAGKEVFTSGVITIKVIGESGAVKNAIEAGIDAVKKLGRNVSSHIILEPDEQLLSVLPEFSNFYFQLNKLPEPIKKTALKAAKELPLDDVTEKKENIAEPAAGKENIPDNRKGLRLTEAKKLLKRKKPIKIEIKDKPDKKEKEKINSKINYKNDTIERLRKEALGLDKAEKRKVERAKDKEKKEEKKKVEQKIENNNNPGLDTLNVHELRKVARSTINFPIQGREISKANREVLLNYFKSLNK